MTTAKFMIALLLISPCIAIAQVNPSGPTPGDTAIDNFLANEAAFLSERLHAGALTKEEWEAHRSELKKQFFDMLGLWPLPERTPLKATVTGKIERDDFTVEKVHFQSKPGLYVTGNLYLPKKVEGKLPAVLYVCGHSNKGRDGNKTAFQHHGKWFATHGYVCLIIDTLQLGEVAGIHHGTYNRDRWWWHSHGYTSAGVECWNGVRAIDYLVSRPEVDAEKIAATGISGGGASTFWISAADERIKVCVPVSGMSDLESYVSDKICNGHCDCMFLYNNYRWEWTTIAALIAPRPMLFENSGYDTIFPMPGNERIRQRLSLLYKWYEKKPGDLFDIGITPGGHSDNVELRLMAYRWINRHLKGDNSEVAEPQLPTILGKDLRVFPEDSDLPKDSLNDKIDETFVTLAKPSVPTTKDEYSAWSKSLRTELEQRIFRDWPDQVPAASYGVASPTNEAGSVTPMRTEDEVLVITKSHVTTQGTKPTEAQAARIWLVILNADDPEGALPEWTKDVIPTGQTAVVLSPRGCGQTLKWTHKHPPNYVERAHALIGRTVDAGRVLDVQSVARTLHESDAAERTIAVVGKGRAGILGAYAALNELCIAQVIAVEPPVSHNEGPHFLGIMKVLDVPDALGLLAPKHLTLIGANSNEFARTKSAFKAAGHEGRMTTK